LALLAACGGSDAAPTTTTAAVTTTVPEASATDFSRPGIAVIAHRGASAYAPEHTNAAYTLAIDQGADYIEQDVQLTEDGQLVVLHDPSLDRTARGPAEQCTGFVSEKTVDDLATCDVGTWFNEAHPDLAEERFARQRILLLSEVLQDYGGNIRFYIEVKAPGDQPGMVDELLAVLDGADLDTTDPDLPPVVIQSFSAESLEEIHERRPDLPLVQLIRQGEPVPDDEALDAIAAYAVAIGPPKEIVTRDLVDAAVSRCLDVHPYTVDETSEMGSMLDAGVGAMFTNKPDQLVGLLPEQPMDTGLCPAKATADR
jgi:glycerophosphoryl diester phosphodiesterase